MRKFGMLMFMMMMASVMAVPAFAQGTTGAVAGTNWVPLAAAFAIAFAAGLAALGQSRVAGAGGGALGGKPAAGSRVLGFLVFGLAFIGSLVLFTIVFTKFI